jgi:hypothetical protein
MRGCRAERLFSLSVPIFSCLEACHLIASGLAVIDITIIDYEDPELIKQEVRSKKHHFLKLLIPVSSVFVIAIWSPPHKPPVA